MEYETNHMLTLKFKVIARVQPLPEKPWLLRHLERIDLHEGHFSVIMIHIPTRLLSFLARSQTFTASIGRAVSLGLRFGRVIRPARTWNDNILPNRLGFAAGRPVGRLLSRQC